MEINDKAYETWLEMIDAWRNKFSEPLTRRQVVEILLDDRAFNDDIGEFTEPRISCLYFANWEHMCHNYLRFE